MVAQFRNTTISGYMTMSASNYGDSVTKIVSLKVKTVNIYNMQIQVIIDTILK